MSGLCPLKTAAALSAVGCVDLPPFMTILFSSSVFVFVSIFVFFVLAIIVTVLDSYALDIGENAACDLYYITLTHFTRSLSI